MPGKHVNRGQVVNSVSYYKLLKLENRKSTRMISVNESCHTPRTDIKRHSNESRINANMKRSVNSTSPNAHVTSRMEFGFRTLYKSTTIKLRLFRICHPTAKIRIFLKHKFVSFDEHPQLKRQNSRLILLNDELSGALTAITGHSAPHPYFRNRDHEAIVLWITSPRIIIGKVAKSQPTSQ